MFLTPCAIDLELSRLARLLEIPPPEGGGIVWEALDEAATLVGLLSDRDPRPGSDSLWDAVATRLIATLGLTSVMAERLGRARQRQVTIDAAARISDLLLLPGAGYAGRVGATTVKSADGWITVAAVTDLHAEYLDICTGATVDADRELALRRWSAARTSDTASQELQLWRIPAAPVDAREWSPQSYMRRRSAVRPAPARHLTADERPLAGTRVVELGALWAGPLATRLLHDLGAHVVKIDMPGREDGLQSGHPWLFRHLSSAKERRTLDLRLPEDRAQFLSMAAGALVVENMSARVLPNLGLDAASLVAEQRSRVVSLRAFSRHPDWAGLGSVIEMAGGLAMNDSEGSPSPAPFPVSDALAGAYGALVAVVSLGRPPGHATVGQVEDVVATIHDASAAVLPAAMAA